MQIFIMRHGQASFQAESDAKRQLTNQGMLEAELMGKRLNELSIAPDLVWVSPYIRAQQTYKALASTLTCKKVETVSVITPDGSAQEVHDLIDGELSVNKFEQLLLVSHMPIVSYLVSTLTQHQQAPLFQTAAIVEINYDIETMKGEYIRMLTPSD
ncbi:phosphohistidine phosphatase SixA [Thalassotalea sp. M1531]|uniref:Phosphohistidine phosphatase SixA n=1 Tax=Thalassotalea algicola TaxID=2716224 RepID=A0A7Y0LF47_9GAMM|nr:phosphohistidine phosphatase SixA [Thalassotalea algicola]NMP32997.1 phosphohistidine phosphatase SixA [Thalassotalea algicola]